MKTLLLFLTLSSVLIAQEDHVYKDLSSALKNPQQVYHLKLRRKSLTKFPQELSSFPNLKVLDLSKNKITTIPDSLAFLSNLIKLNLSKNQIEFIPESIYELTDLEELDLWDNFIEVLPRSLENLKNLNLIDIRGVALSHKKNTKYVSMLKGVNVLMSPPCDCQER